MSILFETSTLADGPMGSGKEPSDEHIARRRDFVASFGSYRTPVMARAEHGVVVNVVDEQYEGALVQGDGLVTLSDRLPLMVAHSDCVPVFFWSKNERLCGIVHAGWRGVVAGIVIEAVRVCRELGVASEDLRVEFGPHIGPCCFVIQEDVASQLRPIAEGAVVTLDGSMRGALATALVHQLINTGVPESNIHHDAPCTSCDPQKRFASYRRDGEVTKNMVSFIVRT